MYYDSSVYTGMLDWTPSGEQSRKYKGKEPRPVDPDILLVKLRPGQVSQSFLVMVSAGVGVERLLTDAGRRHALLCEQGNWRSARQVFTSR
jgi:DNA-directed RNA polymerase I and III subunit RPAC1